MLDKIITYSFYALFFLTPLIWTPINYELFEYNKMIVVYLLTTIIVGSWLLKNINQKSLILKRSPLDIPILLFLLANILSTIFSIDQHTSIWGYYSRSNGGLLSIISYSLLYFAAISNLDKEKVINLLKAAILGGVIVALYAIPEHFGISPSCVLLKKEFNADCWVQDVMARVFATLGQPNWLASYLSMLIFPAFYFLLSATQKMHLRWYLVLVGLYLAFTFTYSRSGALGLTVGMGVLLSLLFWKEQQLLKSLKSRIIIILGIFFLINIIYGSAITRFQLTQLLPQAPTQPSAKAPTLTQLETGGTESGQIRLIVWQGALDIFKHYPLFGSGVETFAYAYYQYRPIAHNLVSEWDFLYNKAHNEFLNYLANTGILGFASYLGLIVTFIVWSIKSLYKKNKDKLLVAAILGSYITYHVGNFFGFSVVITALFFYLFPAIAFVSTDAVYSIKLSKFFSIFPPVFKAYRVLIVLITIYILLNIVVKVWYSDTFFASGMHNSDVGNAGKAYQLLSAAITLNSGEPLYHSELGYVAASAALSSQDIDATLSGQLKDEAILETEKALFISPKNTSLWRTATRTYYQLSALDISKLYPSDINFTDKTIETIDKTITLAPSDAKLYYNKAVILGQAERNVEAIEALKKAIELKSNYREAYFAISLFLFDEGQETEAVEAMNKVLQLVPGDADATLQLNEWGKQGIATDSAKP